MIYIKMEGELWQFKIYHSMCDIFYNKYELFNELYIPELNYSLNAIGGQYNILKPSSDRYQNKNIFFNKKVIKLLKYVSIDKRDQIKIKKIIKNNKLS